jgi:hypothetical protein
MTKLLSSIGEMVSKISVTERQEDSITTSINNLNTHLTKDECDLEVVETFTNGSWERDTILRPLDDVDVFAVLDRYKWQDDDGDLPKPKTVLKNFKDFLNGLGDYKDKVSQSRPCVSIQLDKINFDVLPSFPEGEGYMMPNEDLDSWTFTNPKQLSQNLESADEYCDYQLKAVIKAVKYWNRENGKLIPSFNIEEVAISIFDTNNFADLEEGIRRWFAEASTYLKKKDFKSENYFETSKNNISEVKKKLAEAKNLVDDKKEADAIKIWKEIFGKEFPTADTEEAKNFSKLLAAGGLKIGSTGILSDLNGRSVPASSGYYGEV